MCYHRSGAYHAATPNGHTGEDEHPRAQPALVLDDDVPLVCGLGVDGNPGLDAVVRGGDVHLRSEEAVLANANPAGVVTGP